MLIMECEEAEGEPSTMEIGATTGAGADSALPAPPPAATGDAAGAAALASGEPGSGGKPAPLTRAEARRLARATAASLSDARVASLGERNRRVDAFPPLYADALDVGVGSAIRLPAKSCWSIGVAPGVPPPPSEPAP